IGVTPPIHLVCGEVDIMQACEVVGHPLEPPLFLGADVYCRFSAHAFGLPLEYFAHADPPEPAVEDTIPRPMAMAFSQPEPDPGFVASQEDVNAGIEAVLVANAAIKPDASCPDEDSIAHLKTPPGKVVYQRQYTIPQKMVEPIDKIIHQWLDEGVIERAPVGT